jgi:hypothetical protein
VRSFIICSLLEILLYALLVEEVRNTKFSFENLKIRYHVGDLVVDVRIILKLF